MYIRVKRNKTTYFIQCDPIETILNIKQKLQSITDHPPNNQRLILLATNNILDDSKTLVDQKALVVDPVVEGVRLRKVLMDESLKWESFHNRISEIHFGDSADPH
ncbi:hypothetical protein ZWY2020_034824 [Hordeum vulgare]|nr:hypothetical protein ZWY2020_034824 [Hordeum vulgare]